MNSNPESPSLPLLPKVLGELHHAKRVNERKFELKVTRLAEWMADDEAPPGSDDEARRRAVAYCRRLILRDFTTDRAGRTFAFDFAATFLQQCGLPIESSRLAIYAAHVHGGVPLNEFRDVVKAVKRIERHALALIGALEARPDLAALPDLSTLDHSAAGTRAMTSAPEGGCSRQAAAPASFPTRLSGRRATVISAFVHGAPFADFDAIAAAIPCKNSGSFRELVAEFYENPVIIEYTDGGYDLAPDARTFYTPRVSPAPDSTPTG
jgi:hypothetical protein